MSSPADALLERLRADVADLRDLRDKDPAEAQRIYETLVKTLMSWPAPLADPRGA